MGEDTGAVSSTSGSDVSLAGVVTPLPATAEYDGATQNGVTLMHDSLAGHRADRWLIATEKQTQRQHQTTWSAASCTDNLLLAHNSLGACLNSTAEPTMTHMTALAPGATHLSQPLHEALDGTDLPLTGNLDSNAASAMTLTSAGRQHSQSSLLGVRTTHPFHDTGPISQRMECIAPASPANPVLSSPPPPPIMPCSGFTGPNQAFLPPLTPGPLLAGALRSDALQEHIQPTNTPGLPMQGMDCIASRRDLLASAVLTSTQLPTMPHSGFASSDQPFASPLTPDLSESNLPQLMSSTLPSNTAMLCEPDPTARLHVPPQYQPTDLDLYSTGLTTHNHSTSVQPSSWQLPPQYPMHSMANAPLPPQVSLYVGGAPQLGYPMEQHGSQIPTFAGNTGFTEQQLRQVLHLHHNGTYPGPAHGLSVQLAKEIRAAQKDMSPLDIQRNQTRLLRHWLLANRLNPYPSNEQQLQLARMTGKNKQQVANWFANTRRQIKKIGMHVYSEGLHPDEEFIYRSIGPDRSFTTDSPEEQT